MTAGGGLSGRGGADFVAQRRNWGNRASLTRTLPVGVMVDVERDFTSPYLSITSGRNLRHLTAFWRRRGSDDR